MFFKELKPRKANGFQPAFFPTITTSLNGFPNTIRRTKLEPSLEIAVPELVPLMPLHLCQLNRWNCIENE
jgi:hypothetical protein